MSTFVIRTPFTTVRRPTRTTNEQRQVDRKLAALLAIRPEDLTPLQRLKLSQLRAQQ